MKIKTAKFSLPMESDDVSSWHYFKLHSRPNSNGSLLVVSVPLMAIAHANWKVETSATVSAKADD